MTNPPLRLSNPFRDEPEQKAITGKISKQVFDDFFVHMLAGNHGACRSLVSIFFQKLHAHAINDLKIPVIWDDENPGHFALIMSRLNFNEHRPECPRCANPSPSKPKTKPVSSGRKPRTTTRSGSAGEDASGKANEESFSVRDLNPQIPQTQKAT